METEIILIRHGESLANKTRYMIGQTDVDLSERGREQAAATAEFLKDEHIDAVYASDLLRAYNTALPNAERRGLTVITDVGLRETYVGDWENIPFETVRSEQAELYSKWCNDFGNMTFPNGESTYGSGMRFLDAVERIAAANLGKRIIIAAHAGVMRAFWGIISGFGADELGEAFQFPTNASCSYLRYDGERLVPEKYSVNAHLEKIGFLPATGNIKK